MLKKIKKRLAKKRLAAAMTLALVLSAPATPARADIGAQSFSDGAPHTVTDNIVTPGAIGLTVSNAGTSAAMTGYSIGPSSLGVNATNSGFITLTNVTITSTDYSLQAMTGGVITVNGGAINGRGALAHHNGTITLTNVAVTGTSYGIAAPTLATVTMTGGSITSSFRGVYTGDSTVTLTNVAVTSTDSGIVVISGGTVTLTNVAVTSTGGYALHNSGGTINATVNGQTISGASALLYSEDIGLPTVINLTATGASRLYGTATTLSGGMANLTLGGSAAWTMPGTSNLTTLTLNGGTVSFAAPSGGYKTLAVMGNLSGSGGTFNLNADLLDGQYDVVNINNGAASGSHQVFVADQRGSAPYLYQVVKVVNLHEAAINTATFSGGGDFGAYRYAIASGADVPAGYSGVGSLTDIYLYNTFVPSPRTEAAVSTSASPGVLWYGEMNDIKKRMGELRLGASSGDFWARTYAGKYTVKPSGGQPFDQLMRGLEIGKDIPTAIAHGKRYLGWVAGAGRADNTFAAGGSGGTDSFYLGAYGSWLWDNGSYLDIVAKHNWFSHSFTAPLLGGGNDSAAYKNTGFGLSVETGKRYEQGGGVFVEPQVELAALWSEGKNYFTTNGLYVIAPATTSLQLRLGAAIGKKTALTDGGSREVYGKLSWVEELAGQSHTTVDTSSFDSSLKGGRLVAGLGFVEDNAKRQLYLDFETAWGKTTSKPWGVNLGCRWKL